jgi:nicotinamidase-related amidase
MRPATDALIVIDLQNDFCPGGALAVAGGDEIIPRINDLMQDFPVRVLSQDWHPAGHTSFAASHPGAAPFSMIDMPYGPQVLWPVHCVQGTTGAAFHARLDVDAAHLVLRKGFHPGIDSYSAFFENDRTTPTGLDGYLKSQGRHIGDAGGSCHRFLRCLVGNRRGAPRVCGDRPGRGIARHRPERIAGRSTPSDARRWRQAGGLRWSILPQGFTTTNGRSIRSFGR